MLKGNNDNQILKYIAMKLTYMQYVLDFYIENLHTNYEEKKLWGLKPINLNPLYEIKLYKFIWSFYPKNLLFSTFNLIHIRNATTLDCFSGSLQPRWRNEGFQPKIQISNPWLRNQEWYDTINILSMRPFLKNERSLNELNAIFSQSLQYLYDLYPFKGL